MKKQKRNYRVSLYIIIPVIFSGLAIIAGLVSFRVTQYYLGFDQNLTRPILIWVLLIGTVALLCGLLVTKLLLDPMRRFISIAKDIPALSAHVAEDAAGGRAMDEIKRFSQVAQKVTDVLSKVDARQLFPEIVGESMSMRGVLSQIIKVAPLDSTVLIMGESGTGKELAATSIFAHSHRKSHPFIRINCAAMPGDLLESELFGHEKGAFTGAVQRKVGKFEAANGGTIFLDEIGDMPLNLQAKILRVLQEREFDRVGGNHPIKVDVRFIAATNKNLEAMVREGLFREDLYFRLNVFSIVLPALDDHKEDVPLLVERFLESAPRKVKMDTLALQLMMGYNWPGNIRELQNVVERSAVLADNGEIQVDHLPDSITRGISAPIMRTATNPNASLDDHLKEIEKGMIIDALRRADGVQVKAAELLGINQRSLWHRVKKYDIEVSSFKHIK